VCICKEQRNILLEIRRRKENWIGHILRRNCLLQRVTEGKVKGGIEVTGRRGRRPRKLLDDLKEMRGYSYLKEEALDRIMWTARFGRGFGPVVRYRLLNAWKSVTLIMQDAKRMRRIILSSDACLVLTYFTTSSLEQHDFSRGKMLLNVKCVFWFSIQFSPKHLSS
jgi:hypothetical protein